MPGEVARAVAAVPGVGAVEVRLVWEPAWTKDKMSDDARLALGLE
jgi:metal-sulfur cluster biosynthetic enzyme